MIIRDFNLDNLSREEYIFFIQCLMNYYAVLFGDNLIETLTEIRKDK